MDDPTLQYINHITEHSLHSLDELAHEQVSSSCQLCMYVIWHQQVSSDGMYVYLNYRYIENSNNNNNSLVRGIICQPHVLQAKLRKGSDLYSPTGRHHSLSTTSNNNNSLSLHTTDLNYSTAAVPIHCSTLDGFGMADERPADRPESLQRPATIEESESVDFGTMKTSPESIAPSNQSGN